MTFLIQSNLTDCSYFCKNQTMFNETNANDLRLLFYLENSFNERQKIRLVEDIQTNYASRKFLYKNFLKLVLKHKQK